MTLQGHDLFWHQPLLKRTLNQPPDIIPHFMTASHLASFTCLISGPFVSRFSLRFLSFLRWFCNVCATTWSSWSQICNHRRQWSCGKGRCPFWFIKIKIQPIFLKTKSLWSLRFFIQMNNELLDFDFMFFFLCQLPIDHVFKPRLGSNFLD